jgi:predicted alpha/beta-hydrolase family hydrolase
MQETFEKGPVNGFLHQPTGKPRRGLVLTHGAGGNCQLPLLVAAAEAFANEGYAVLRSDLAFRKKGRGSPFPAGAAADREGLREAAAAMRELTGKAVILGGQSYGGRQATMLAAEQPDAAEGLLLFSYPLHPPGKPEQLRTTHFPALRTPAVFVSGTKDPFGTVAELTAALGLIPSSPQYLQIERAGHDLARGKFDWTPVIQAVESLRLNR